MSIYYVIFLEKFFLSYANDKGIFCCITLYTNVTFESFKCNEHSKTSKKKKKMLEEKQYSMK